MLGFIGLGLAILGGSALWLEPRLTQVPVVIVSSDDQPESLERARQAGASDYIIKPASLDSLEETLKKLNFVA